MADWYVYQHDGDPLGPWSTDAVAEAILAGKLAPDVWVAAPGGPRWLRALDVPVIAGLVEGLPTRPRRDSGLRLIPGAHAIEAGRPNFGSTMMIVKDDELDLAEPELGGVIEATPPTTRGYASPDDTLKVNVNVVTREMAARPQDLALAAGGDDFNTDPAMPPPSTTPSLPPGTRTEVESVEAPSTDRRRRRKGA